MNQYLYAMQVGANRTKIGIALSPRCRRDAHEKAAQEKVTITHVWELENALRFETALKLTNENSEWFSGNSDVIADLIKKTANECNVTLALIEGECEQRGRDVKLITMINDSEKKEIEEWADKFMPAQFGRKSAAVRALIRVAIDSGVVPTPEQIDASLPSNLEKARQRKIKEQS